MIIISVKQGYKYKYEGEIDITIDDTFLSIRWFIDDIPSDDDKLTTWSTNGYDKFWLKDIVLIENVHWLDYE